MIMDMGVKVEDIHILQIRFLGYLNQKNVADFKGKLRISCAKKL